MPRLAPRLELPPEPDLERLPRYAARLQLAEIHQHYYGPISFRTLETWPLVWRRVNGRAVAEVRAFLAEAQRRFDAAPVIRGGRNDRTAAAYIGKTPHGSQSKGA
jgi:hypothetical protein